jgi:tRNA(fMet)-specific endonuclease VapC
MYVLDTDTVIYAMKGVPEVVDALARRRQAPVMISVITQGELLYGARRSARPQQNLARVRRLAEALPLIDVTPGVIETFTDLKTSLDRWGLPLDDFDLIIAATASMLGATLVTNNTKHFSRIGGLALENWKEA